ncbi:glutathione S-transferase domain-containing protein [Mucor ambiguus]|uniref:Glutathione S-transferase domain-containing protein n=1 Tax=Mucor ambiguus TaxID=91626 RepID=A0A0C9N5X5_9FUNG|nr:glutathione S-transferase domain-containing protein [Mucor ambiguus]
MTLKLKSDKRPHVPIIVHNDKPVVDSWHIARYLEEQFPTCPSLFHGNVATHKFFQNYSEKHINTPIFRLVLLDVHQSAGDQAMQDWFRQDRESWMRGKTIEQFVGDVDENIAKLKTGITIVSAHLKEFLFVTGEQPGWADVVFLSHLTFLAALKPEIFEDHVLSDENVRAYWNRTKYIRNGVASPNL